MGSGRGAAGEFDLELCAPAGALRGSCCLCGALGRAALCRLTTGCRGGGCALRRGRERARRVRGGRRGAGCRLLAAVRPGALHHPARRGAAALLLVAAHFRAGSLCRRRRRLGFVRAHNLVRARARAQTAAARLVTDRRMRRSACDHMGDRTGVAPAVVRPCAHARMGRGAQTPALNPRSLAGDLHAHAHVRTRTPWQHVRACTHLYCMRGERCIWQVCNNVNI